MRAGGPDLLAVDDPVVALLLRARAQARDVGAAGGLREQLAPDLFAGGELRQIMAFMLLIAIGHHGRPAHALADLERLRQLAVDALLLLPDHALDRGRAAPAIFLRPMQAGPAGLGLLLLPGLADIDDLFLLQPDTAERGLRKFGLILLRRIGVDPLAGPRRGIRLPAGCHRNSWRTSHSRLSYPARVLMARRRPCAVSIDKLAPILRDAALCAAPQDDGLFMPVPWSVSC